MSQFAVRVEFPGKPKAYYQPFHVDMRKAEYRRVIVREGRGYHLPHAEYVKSSETLNLTLIMAEATEIASKHHAEPRVFVTEIKDWLATGLRRVTAQDPDTEA